MNYVTQALDYLKQYPELLPILLGTLASWAIATLLEAAFIPDTWTERRQQRFTILASVITGTLISSIAWRYLDPADPRPLRITVSFACALLSPLTYVWIAKVLTHFFPWIGSVWAVQTPAVPIQPPAAPGP